MKGNIYGIKNEMEKDMMKTVIYYMKSKMEQVKQKNMMMKVN